VYGGEGSDELWASHAFSFYVRRRRPDLDWTTYRVHDFTKQASNNFVREWKVWNHHGLEVRLPFLNQHVVEYILSLPEDTCRDNTWHAKRPLQAAFRQDLPQWVCERQKLGFQDGLKIKKPLAQGMNMTQAALGSWYRQQYNHLFRGARP
jgi:asparagine synthetase B (glutamine-hydrolysing)